MSIYAKVFFNLQRKFNKTTLLRLSGNHAHVSATNLSRTLTCLARSPEKYVYPFQYRRCTVEAYEEEEQTQKENKTKFGKESIRLHRFFENSIHYKDSIASLPTAIQDVTDETATMLLNTDWSDKSITDILYGFKKLSYHSMSNNKPFPAEMYEGILGVITMKIPTMSQEETLKFLKYLLPLNKQLDSSFAYKKLLNKLDIYFKDKVIYTSYNNLLLTADLLYKLELENSNMMWITLRKLGGKAQKLTAKNLVQFLFYLTVCRKQQVNMYDIEYRLAQCLEDISINELGIAALGFFKTKSILRCPELITQIIEKLKKDINVVEDVTFASLMKLIRYSSKLQLKPVYASLIRTVIEEESRFPLICLTHVAHMATKAGIYDKDFMDIIMTRFNDIKSTVRIKDIERVLHTIVTLCPSTDPLASTVYQNVIEELLSSYKTTRAEEIMRYPEILARIQLFLSYRSLYCEELLRFVFNTALTSKMRLGNESLLPTEFLYLEYNVKIEVPTYTGPWLDKRQRRILRKKDRTIIMDAYHRNSTAKFLSEIVYACKEELNTDITMSVQYVLPHYLTPNIVLGFNKKNELVPVDDILSSFPDDEIKFVNVEEYRDIKWVALCPITVAQEISNLNEFSGYAEARLRLLRRIGYLPIPISFNTWAKLDKMAQKKVYIRNLLHSVIIPQSDNEAECIKSISEN